ncbi:MAG: protein kinase [Bacillales bacterium]|nr:protein kinase [Bacillales bacterium]
MLRMKKWMDIFERPLKIGTILKNRYEILRLMGKGGYGLVYEAFDYSLGQKVVVKQLRKRREKSKKEWLAFENEAAILKSLSHPAFPSYVDSFQDQTGRFIVMEKLDGCSFEELIFQQKQEFNHDDSLRILLDALKLVHFLHSRGIIHRDLRIPNILMNNDQLFIIDFGLARRIGDRDDFNENPSNHLARQSISFQEDLMALGHFVLFLLYSTYKPVSIREKSWEEELKLPRKTKEVIRRMLHISPPYDSVEQTIEDVQSILFSSPKSQIEKSLFITQNG